MKPGRVRRELTALYAIGTLAILLITLLALRSYTRNALLTEHAAGTERAIGLIRAFFRAELAEYREVDFTVSHVAAELVLDGIEVEFLDALGQRTAIARAGASTPLSPPVALHELALDSALAPGWQMRIRISGAELEHALSRNDRLTIVSVYIAVVVAYALAWFMTGRALAPVGAMADAATALGADPSARLPVADADDEFGRLGAAFNGLLQRLNAGTMQQRRFLADAAHELRTPVTRMFTEADLRLLSDPSPEDRETLARIRRELQDTSQLVDELMHVARSDAGAVSFEPVPLFLDDVVADTIGLWSPELARREIALDAAGLEETRILGDATLLPRLVGTLLGNAVRYTPNGGRIAVTVRPDGGGASLSIDDSGPGIPPAEREVIFERFARGIEARKRAPEGSGLGLSIAADIVRRHGGTITVTDSPLGGARFEVRIPSASAAR